MSGLKKDKIVRIVVLLIMILISCVGCATLAEDMIAFTHSAFLPIGATKNEVDLQVDHILGKPIRELYADKNIEDELLAFEYNFTVDYNLVLYYYKNRLVQADLHKPGEYKYPDYRGDYKTVTKDVPSGQIAGYLLTSSGKTASIKTLWKK
jgi:hypothetical protein